MAVNVKRAGKRTVFSGMGAPLACLNKNGNEMGSIDLQQLRSKTGKIEYGLQNGAFAYPCFHYNTKAQALLSFACALCGDT